MVAQGSELDVVQQEATAYVVNRSTGAVSRVDGATFTVSPPATPIPGAGPGLRAYAGPKALYALDTRRGVVASADPGTLAGRGEPLAWARRPTPSSTATG